jgi:hypothetical protein
MQLKFIGRACADFYESEVAFNYSKKLYETAQYDLTDQINSTNDFNTV